MLTRRLPRYARLLALSLRVSLTVGLQYRWSFLVDGVVAIAWTAVGVVPLAVALHDRPPVAGWTFDRALVVTGFFALLHAALEGAVSPALAAVVDHIRQGTLDFVLLKPADAQFLVSTAKFEAWKIVDALFGLAILGWAFHRMGVAPAPVHVLTASLVFGASLVALYSIWVLAISAAFWVVRLDNLAYLLSSVLDFARWPVGVFKGATRLVFTFVIPIGLMTTYPAEALLGTLDARTGVASVVGAVAFAALARIVWTRALASYTSASS